MELDVTREPAVIRAGTTVGVSLGTSGRGQLKVLNQAGSETGYALVEGAHPVGEPRIRDHVHSRHEETFVVLEGEYEVRLGDDIVLARAGDYVFIPRGTPHTYRNASSEPARVLNIISPPDGVQLLAELGELAGKSVDEAQLADIHARHDAFLVPPLPDW